MTDRAIGYGAGTRDLTEQAEHAAAVRRRGRRRSRRSDQIWVVETNLDDISGELIGYCTSRLWEAGALDVYTTAIQMKKNRPGVMLSVLCSRPTSSGSRPFCSARRRTLGVRRWPVSRHKLDRRQHEVQTPWGPIDGVLAFLPGHPPSFSPEFETCRRVAEERNVPLRQVIEAAAKAFDPKKGSDLFSADLGRQSP